MLVKHPRAAIAVVLVALPALVATARAEEDVCSVGLQAVESGDDPTAFVALERCLEGDPAEAVRVAAKKGLRAATTRLRDGAFAEVSLAIEPAGVEVRVASVKVAVPAQGTLFLPRGKHSLRASAPGYESVETLVVVSDRERQTVVLRLQQGGETTPDVVEGSVNFDEEPPAALPASRPQKAADFDSLIPEKFAKGQPGEHQDAVARAPRWPWAIVATGVIAGAAGGVVHVRGDERLALGLYLGGAAMIAGGATAVVLSRPSNRSSTAIPDDPELTSGPHPRRFWVAFATSF